MPVLQVCMSNIGKIGVPEEENGNKGTEQVFKTKIQENFTEIKFLSIEKESIGRSNICLGKLI